MGCSTCGKGPRLTPVDPHAPKMESSNVKSYRLRPLRARQADALVVPKPVTPVSPIEEAMREKGALLGDTKPPGLSGVEKEDIET